MINSVQDVSVLSQSFWSRWNSGWLLRFLALSHAVTCFCNFNMITFTREELLFFFFFTHLYENRKSCWDFGQRSVSCFQTCTELHIISWHSPEGLYVRTKTCGWEAPDFSPASPLCSTSIWLSFSLDLCAASLAFTVSGWPCLAPSASSRRIAPLVNERFCSSALGRCWTSLFTKTDNHMY